MDRQLSDHFRLICWSNIEQLFMGSRQELLPNSCCHRGLKTYWVTQYLTSMVTKPGFQPQLLLALGDASRLVVITRSWMSDQSSIQEFDPLCKVVHSVPKLVSLLLMLRFACHGARLFFIIKTFCKTMYIVDCRTSSLLLRYSRVLVLHILAKPSKFGHSVTEWSTEH